MDDHQDHHDREQREERDRRIDEEVESHVEEGRRSGKAWQEREMRMAGEAAKTGDTSELGGTVLSEAFLGQDAAQILGDPPFEAASTSVLDQPLLVVAQEAKVVETSDRYDYARPDGTVLAVGEQTNQGTARKMLRMVSNLDSMMKSVVEVTQDGERVFAMERKGSVGKNTMVVTDADGNEVGEVKQTKKGRKRASFELRAGGRVLATMQTGRIRAGQGYDIVDPDGELVAYVRRLHEGALESAAKSMLSKADNYVLRVARPLTDPLRTLVVATPMSVDSAISQDEGGVEVGDVKRLWRKLT